MNRLQKLSLYKQILKNAKLYPSIKRKIIYEEIRSEFRKNQTLTDEKKLDLCWQAAYRGLKQLQMFTSLDKKSGNWSVSLEQNPMPKKSE